jgi:AcrR family transcriptional regulator
MTETTLRERKKQQVRQRILDVCGRLFRTRGFDETTVDDIVGEVDVSRQTFFNSARRCRASR